jgi:hypothetical protein
LGDRSSGLVKQKAALKEKKLSTQINEKFYDIVLMQIKNITVKPLYKTIKRQYIYSSIEYSEVVLVFLNVMMQV